MLFSGLAGFAGVTTTAGASEHTFDDARDYTDEANVTAFMPERTDHYPGSQNQENGSAFALASGQDALRSISDAEGAYLHYLIVDAEWIDFSACSVENVAVLGFDRGSNRSGTNVDESIVQNHKDVTFEDGRVTVEFATFEDFTGEPPYGEPDDQLVAGLGEGSNGGPCLTMTDEPGWYQGQGFINGTEADNGEGEEPSDDAKHVGLKAASNYMYICDCESRAEAEEKLGPAPGSDSGSGGTPTPTPRPTETPTPTETLTPAQQHDSTATPEGSSSGSSTSTGPAGDTSEPTDSGSASTGSSSTTPTVGSGTGFGSLVGVLALLATALVGHRSRWNR